MGPEAGHMLQAEAEGPSSKKTLPAHGPLKIVGGFWWGVGGICFLIEVFWGGGGVFLSFLGLHSRHREVPRLGV